MQRDLVPGADRFGEQGQILLVVTGWVVTGGAGWLWLAALAAAGVLLGRCMEKWL